MEVSIDDKDLLAMIKAINQGPNRDILRRFVEFLYEEQEDMRVHSQLWGKAIF
jgi:hypothetical protein